MFFFIITIFYTISIQKTMSSINYEWCEFPNLNWEEYLEAVEKKYGLGDEEDDGIDWDKHLEDEHIEYQRKEEEREMEEYERNLMSWEEEDALHRRWVSKIDEKNPKVNRAAKLIQKVMKDWADSVILDAEIAADE